MFNRTIQSIYGPLTLCLILGIGLAILSHSGHTAEPEVWFSFKGKDVNVAEDASGNGVDGVIMGGAQRVPSKEGVFGMGMEFGENKEDFIEFDYLMPNPGTLGFWFKPYWDGAGDGTYRLFDASTVALSFSIGKGTLVGQLEDQFVFLIESALDIDALMTVPAADVVKKDEWMHIAVTWNFVDDAFIYINGEEVATKTGIGPFPEFHRPPRIGGNNKFNYRVAASGANGVIDEFAIYGEALSDKDIQTEMDLRVSDVEPEGKLAVTWGRIKSER
ncbi:LamG domain-containing protein [Candidatus Poribacteria bacterium]|nr:LamG domain-containing protein [Candidatus Poribacteria bacterium]